MANEPIKHDEPIKPGALAPKPSSFTDDQIKIVIADWLQYELDARRSKTISTIEDEKLSELEQRRIIGKRVEYVSGGTSLAILAILMIQIMIPSSPFYSKLGEIPQAIFISASFLSFTIVSGVLIKGLFYKPKDESDDSPIKEAADFLKQFHNNDQ